MQALADVRRGIVMGEFDLDDISGDPECLTELEYTYSVFRLSYSWGTLYEISLSSLADAEDRAAVWALVPEEYMIVDSVETDTMGVGYNGIVHEVTHRLIALDAI